MKKYNQTDIDGNNALILACKNELEDVSLKLLKLQSNK